MMENKSVAVILELDVDGITDEIKELEKLAYQIERKANDLSRKLRRLRIVEAPVDSTLDASE